MSRSAVFLPFEFLKWATSGKLDFYHYVFDPYLKVKLHQSASKFYLTSELFIINSNFVHWLRANTTPQLPVCLRVGSCGQLLHHAFVPISLLLIIFMIPWHYYLFTSCVVRQIDLFLCSEVMYLLSLVLMLQFGCFSLSKNVLLLLLLSLNALFRFSNITSLSRCSAKLRHRFGTFPHYCACTRKLGSLEKQCQQWVGSVKRVLFPPCSFSASSMIITSVQKKFQFIKFEQSSHKLL